MDLKSKTDAQLVEAAILNPENFSALVERYEAKLIRYIYRFAGISKIESEDILQEVFIKVYRHLNAYDAEMKFSSWIYRIAHNEALNYIKNSKYKKEVNTEEDVVQLIDLLSSDVDLVKEFKQKELKENISVLLDTLPLHYKEVLVLYYIEEKSYQEIGDILKKPIGTVGTLINRAKEKLKIALQTSALFNH